MSETKSEVKTVGHSEKFSLTSEIFLIFLIFFDFFEISLGIWNFARHCS